MLSSSRPDERLAHDVLGERAEHFQLGRGLFGQIEAIGAPVGRVVAPLDETRGAQFVDEAGERDRRESSASASSLCFTPSQRCSRTSTAHWARVVPTSRARWSE